MSSCRVHYDWVYFVRRDDVSARVQREHKTELVAKCRPVRSGSERGSGLGGSLGGKNRCVLNSLGHRQSHDSGLGAACCDAIENGEWSVQKRNVRVIQPCGFANRLLKIHAFRQNT